jgi:TatD DNase family protein
MPENNHPLFDSHAHLDAAEFDPDRSQVMERARKVGVTECLVPAVGAAGWPKLHELCAADPGLHPAYGLHPCFLAEHSDDDLARLEDWLDAHPAAAVGECGLDRGEADFERQSRLLHGHFELAHRFDLPLVLHARQAFAQVIDALRAFGKPLRGVVHSFSGSLEQAHELARLGFSVGIGGPVTYERARRLRRTVASLPIECLLLETDAPAQPSSSRRGERNEPAFLPEVLECVAALRHEDPAEIAHATTENARRLFA